MSRFGWIAIIVATLIVASLIGLGVWTANQRQDQSRKNPPQTVIDEKAHRACGLPSAETVAAQEQVDIRSSGFSVAEVSIKIGQTVRWHNRDTNPHRIVSDPHPTHSDCIGLDSPELQTDQSYGFTFTKPGTWVVHDEFIPTNKSRIIVTE